MAILWIEVPLPPKELSPNRSGSHWGKRSRAEAAYKAECAERFAGVGPLKTPVTVHLVFYLGRGVTDLEKYKRSDRFFPKDEDNARSSFKRGQDALAVAGVVPDDGKKYVRTGRTELRTTAKEHRNRACIMVGLETAVDVDEPTGDWVDELSD